MSVQAERFELPPALRPSASQNGDAARRIRPGVSIGEEETDPDPGEWMRDQFSSVFEDYSGPVFTTKNNGEIRGLGPHGLFGQCLGPTGRPHAPTVYCAGEDAYYGYDPEEGIYEALPEPEVRRRADRLLHRCGENANEKGDGVHKLRHGPSKRYIVKAVQEEARVEEETFARDITQLPVDNGLLDLEKLELRDLTPADFARWKLPVPYTDEFRVPRRFMRFLGRMFPSAEDRRLAIDVLAMALAGNPSQRLVLLTGEGGTGKSTFVKLLNQLVGTDAFGELDLENADARFESGHWMDTLVLHQLEADSDLLEGNERFLKALSGQDAMEARRKYATEKTAFQPKALPIITTNTRLTLRLRGDQQAWRRRLIVLKTRGEPLPEDERIQDYEEKLIEAEGPAILRLLAIHASRLLQDGFRGLTPEQQARADRVLEGFDPIPAFVRERVVSEPGARLYSNEAQEAVRDWLESRGYSVPSWKGEITSSLKPLIEDLGGTWTGSLDNHPDYSSKGWRHVRLRE